MKYRPDKKPYNGEDKTPLWSEREERRNTYTGEGSMLINP